MKKLSLLAGALMLAGYSCAMASAPSLMDSTPSSIYTNNFYLGAEASLHHTRYDVPTADDPQMSTLGAALGLYTGYGTTVGDFYLGAELGGGVQPRPERAITHPASGFGNPGTLLYRPYKFYADFIPGVTLGNGVLLFGRIGLEYDKYQLDRFANPATPEPISPDSTMAKGLRLGLGLEDRISPSLTVRGGVNYVRMDDVSILQGPGSGIIIQPNYVSGNVGLGYHFGADSGSFSSSPSLMGDTTSDLFNNNFYAGFQTGAFYLSSDGQVDGVSAPPQNENFGLVNGLYVGYGTDFASGFYLGGEVGANYQAKPDVGATAADAPSAQWASVLLYAPGQFYADITPGFVTSNGWLLFARAGLEENKYNFFHFDNSNPGAGGLLVASGSSYATGWRAGLGAEDQISSNFSLRMGLTWIDMPSISAGSTDSSLTYIEGNAGVSYHFG